MKTDLIIIDVANICYRNWHALRYSTFGPTKVVATFGLLRDLSTIAMRFDCTDFAFCFDIEPYKRLEIYPEYKAKEGTRLCRRLKEDEARTMVRRELDLLRLEILPSLNYHNNYAYSGYEADDLIAFLVKQRLEDLDYLLVSNDQDLYQLLSEHVTMYNPSTKDVIGVKELNLFKRLTPEQYIEYSAIVGGHDNIKGIPGIGPIRALQYIKQGHLLTRRGLEEKITGNQTLIARNRRLITLPFDLLPDPGMVVEFGSGPTQQVWNEVVEGLKLTVLLDKHPCF